jgi:hypothetical protein
VLDLQEKIEFNYIKKREVKFNLEKLNKRYKNRNEKIALCFLLKDSLRLEEIWDKFFINSNNRFKIYAHCWGSPNEFIKKNMIIVPQVKTTWENTLNAIEILLNSAFSDGNDRAIILSESCVPFVNAEIIQNYFNEAGPYTLINRLFPTKHEVRKIREPLTHGCEQWSAVYKDFWEYTMNEGLENFNKSKSFFADNETWITYQIFHNQDLIKKVKLSDYHYVKWIATRNYPHPVTYVDYLFEGRIFDPNKIHVSIIKNIIKSKNYLFGRKFDESTQNYLSNLLTF